MAQAPRRGPDPGSARRPSRVTGALLGLVLAACLLALGAAGHRIWTDHGTDVQEVRRQLETRAVASLKLPELLARGSSKVVYLNREGARLAAGKDESARNRSSILTGAGLNWAQVPAFTGTPERWQQIVNCVRSKFEPYDLQIVDQRPVEGSYVMAMIGGRPQLLGDDLPIAVQSVTGLAPFNGRPIRDAVVMVFSRSLRDNVRSVCETVSMEVAHAFGLDHARHCKDIMTYMPPCGPKRFLDRAIPCGEDEDRPCKDGALVQNSHARLLEVLGPRRAPEPEAPQKGKTPGGQRNISAAPRHVADDGHFHEH